MFAKRETPKQQTQTDLVRQAVDEARRRKAEVEARRDAHYFELREVLARTQPPPADIGAEELERLLARERALRHLLDTSPALERAADAKLRDAEADVVALADYKERLAGRIKDQRAQLAFGAPLNLKVYYAEQKLEDAKRDAPNRVKQLKAECARAELSSEETSTRVSWAEAEGRHFIQLAEEELVIARRIVAEAERKVKADEAALEALG